MSTSTPSRNIQIAQDAMDGILVHHDEASVERHFHPDFIQHNPWAKDGAAHVREMCQFQFGLQARRWVSQGDLVAYHGFYTAPNPLGDQPLLCTDLWRVQGDRIVEHWDALQPLPQAVVDRMLAGAGDGTAAVEPDRVAANVATARRLLELGINAGDPNVVRSLAADDFVDHGAQTDGGREALVSWIERAPRVEIRRTVASGDLVMVHAQIEEGGAARVSFTWLRLSDGRAVERWEVTQPIASPEEVANAHPHF